MPAPMNRDLVDRHVQRVLQVVLGEDVVNVLILVQKGFDVESSVGFEVSLVLENVTEAVELGFIPKLAECGSGYL